MSWNFLDVFDVVLNGLELLGSGSRSTSDRKGLNYDEKPGKKESKRSGYFTEKVSAVLIVLAAFSFFIVFKDPLPVENYTQTLVVTSLIGVGISFVVFFILHVMGLYYFKSIFKLLLFSCSVMGFFISVVMYIYFRSGWFI
ncbi:putative membrane protein [Chryseobacterium sp. PvR013]|uniref:branched-chain amino acid ABC transporter substrate-binding protein n=1 Tax=Chryseobacterium sp. PvR013 TaxID=2806595 RepID=UPI001AE8FC54|nr:branched-chain amino acid ABC transporter substrate-binding protein [Chryseobacterium sp. PvR013]MBP1165014.1 putative membrane protein [Chryseobacterium sp. PvR013]